MKTEIEKTIKYEIVEVFGRPIVSSRDCIELSDEIYQKTKAQLNFNTLRRFFGLVKAEYPPSHSTLAILSRYCGFNSIADISPVKIDRNPEQIESTSLLYYLVSLFNETGVMENNDKTFLSIVRHTIKFLHNHPGLTDKFQSLIAKTPNGQSFYFEQFVNVNQLNSYYGSGLRYYMNEKRTAEGKVFAYSVWLLKEWLSGNDSKVLQYAGQIREEKYTPKGNLYIDCRYYAALLLHARITGLQTEDILIDLYKFYSSAAVQNHAHAEQVFYFECIVAEALILAGYYEDALYYLSNAEVKQKKSECCNYVNSLQCVKLLAAIAVYKTKSSEKAVLIFDTIKPSEFLFISHRYYGIMYLHLANALKRKHSKYNETLQTLVENTGFTRLQTELI
jgi:hypothetical protein